MFQARRLDIVPLIALVGACACTHADVVGERNLAGGAPPGSASADAGPTTPADADGALVLPPGDDGGAPTPAPSLDAGTTGPAPADAGLPHASTATIAVYWGQNGYGGLNMADTAHWEAPLATVCAGATRYDVIVLSFVTSFFSAANQDRYPALNYSGHCTTPWSAADPALLRCPDIESGITACQGRGTRVVLGLGGQGGNYGFASDAEGTTFAQTTWDMFLGGTSAVRPFGNARLDGIDLSIQNGANAGYAAYVTRLRALMQGDPAHRYTISASPQCTYPDPHVGPGVGTLLASVPSSIDFVMVQFYNAACPYGGVTAFQQRFDQWAQIFGPGRPKVLIGLGADPQFSPASFVARADLVSLFGVLTKAQAFGGVALWDASFDQNSASGGQTYGQLIRQDLTAGK